jgi:hypothetical protein
MSERKLAHIEVIESLSPIPDADKIEVAKVLGWECVVKKGEFKVGERIVYVEVDSIMPDKPEYEFLRDRKFRVRTIKLRGQVSQGLVLPIQSYVLHHLPVGYDVTELLGITKYLSPSEREETEQQQNTKHWTKNYKLTKWLWRYEWFRNYIRPITKKWWPEWIAKTDEERIQNLNWDEFYANYKDQEVYVTEKIDYQSVTFTGKILPIFKGWLGKLIPIKKYKFVVCSRNKATENKNSLYWQIAKKYNIKQILKENPNLTIQGEQGSTKVQSNKYGLTEPTMWVFNIIDHEENYHYNCFEIKQFCDEYNLNAVPILYQELRVDRALWRIALRTLTSIGSTVQDFVEFSKGKSVLANIPREGVVIRCIVDGRKVFSFKVVNPDFLLKYD